MLNSFRQAPHAALQLSLAALLSLAPLVVSSAASAQATTPPSTFERAMSHVDLGVLGEGEFTKSTSGTNYLGQSEFLQPSNTLGYLISVSVVKSPLVGLQLNYGYARYSQNFTLGKSTLTTTPAQFFGVQSNAKEYSLGYLAHARRKYFGVTPFAGAGIGTIKFTPTTNGGEGFKQQYRATYFYNLGVETYVLGDHLGARGGFRQQFYNAPDFLTNYVTDNKRTISSEPFLGVFLRF
jgi:opacity protein-like surface antigen